MSDLQTRYQELEAAGRLPLYAYGYATRSRAADADTVLIRLGLQPSGRYLYMDDLDSHTAGQDASAARAAFEQAEPEIASKIEWLRTPQRGYHGFYESYKQLPTGPIYDEHGQHVGERLGDGSVTKDPGRIQPQTLNLSELERLTGFWSVRGGDDSGERWSDRAKQGKQWTAGYTRIRVSTQQLKDFLLAHCGDAGQKRVNAFDTAGDRSEDAARLMLTLLYGAYKLPCGPSFHERCRTVMAYWMAAKSYGKADDKDYNQEKDGCALLAAIIHGDTMKSGKAWIPPYWAGSRTTSEPAVETDKGSQATITRPAHRPVGDHAKHLATFRRVLESIVPDDFGRRTYTLAYLAERMKAAHCPAKPRTIQSYLKELRGDGTNGEIVTAQIGGNGRPYAVLTSQFGGAIKSQKRVETGAKSPAFGGANEIAPERIQTPQSADLSPQCKEDHQNPSAPPIDTLGGQVADAFDALAGHARITWLKVEKYIRQLHGAEWPRVNLRAAVNYEREARKRQRMLAAIASLNLRGLKSELRFAEHMYDKATSQRSESARFWYVYRAKLQAELLTRPAPAEKPKRRKVCEALPDVRAVAAQYQRDLWDVVEQDRAWRPIPALTPRAAPGAQASFGAPSSPPAGGTDGTFTSLMAGIRAYHEREAAHG